MASFGASFGGNISASLAKDIANHKGHREVGIIDRIHAAIIVLSFFFTFFIFSMLDYIFPHLFKYLHDFMDWKDNYVILTYGKILFIVALLLPVIVIITKKFIRLSIWYALGIFMVTMGTSITMLVWAMAKS